MTAVHLYDALRRARDDDERTRLIAEAFEEFETRSPNLGEKATNAALRETELRLQKEIEQIRREIAETEDRLRKEIAEVEARLLRTMGRHTTIIVTAIGLFAAPLRWGG